MRLFLYLFLLICTAPSTLLDSISLTTWMKLQNKLRRVAGNAWILDHFRRRSMTEIESHSMFRRSHSTPTSASVHRHLHKHE